ncbi:hypothetical protein GCM10027090_26540 [Sinomonas soli]
MEGLALRVLGAVYLDETGVDPVAELRDHYDRVVDHYPGLGLICVEFDQVSKALSLCSLDPIHAPEPMIDGPGAAAVRQDPNLVATPDRSARKFDGLWLMLFEDKTERATLGQRGNLRLEICTELWVYLLGLPEKLS